MRIKKTHSSHEPTKHSHELNALKKFVLIVNKKKQRCVFTRICDLGNIAGGHNPKESFRIYTIPHPPTSQKGKSYQRCHFLIYRSSHRSHLKPETLLKKRPWHRCFPVSVVKFQKTPFLQNTFGRLLWIYFFLLSSAFSHITERGVSDPL